MTGIPLEPRTFNASDYDYGSPYFLRELAGFEATRDRLLQQQLQQSQLTRVMVATPSMMQVPEQTMRKPASDWSDDDLLGAARFWGIPLRQAQMMPREQLVATVDQLRAAARPSDEESSMLINGMAPIAMAASGAGQALTRMLRSLPFVGESLGRVGAIREANLWLKSLEEGVRASTPESISPVLTTFEVGGNVGSMIVPSVAAWRAAGALGAFVPYASRLSPMVRGAAQGAASLYMLEGGSKEFKENPALMLGLGAGFGALEPMAVQAWMRYKGVTDAAANKATKAFVPVEVDFSTPPAGLEPTAAVVDDAFTAMQRMEGLQQQAIFEGGQLTPLPEGFIAMNTPESEAMRQFFDVPPSAPVGQTPTGVALDNYNRILAERARRAAMTPQQRSTLKAMLERQGLPYELSLEGDLASEAAVRGLPPRTPANYGMNVERAESTALGLSKADAVVNSPDAPELIASPELNDVSVARAQLSSTPGGTNIVTGVADPAAFASATTSDLGAYVRYAKPKGSTRLDAIVSDRPITNKMVKEYETHGAYTGQSVVTNGGLTGRIVGMQGETATVQLAHSGAKVTTRVSELKPGYQSGDVAEAPQLWDQFLDFAESKAAATSADVVGDYLPAQLDAVLNRYMPQYLDEFLDNAGITYKGDRARLMRYFDERYVDAFKSLAPVESQAAEVMTSRALGLLDNYPAASPLAAVDALAASKGYIVAPVRNGFEIIDNTRHEAGKKAAAVKLKDLDAVNAWLQNVNRELPDIAPKTLVPGEIAPMHWQEATQLPNLNGRAEVGIVDELNDLIPTNTDSGVAEIAAQASALDKNGQLGKLQQLYLNAFANLSSMRRVMARMDEFAQEAQMPGLSVFQDYQKVSVANTARGNYAAPLQEQATEVLRKIRAVNRRNGEWTRVYLIEDPVERLSAAKAAKFTQSEIEAFDDIGALWHEWFGKTGLPVEREIKNYMPLLQKMQSTGDFSGFELWKVSPASDAFFKHVRGAGVNARELDPEILLNSYINALSNEQGFNTAFNEVADKWNLIAKEVPELKPVTDVMLNWLHTVQYGYQPGPDAMLDWTHAMTKLMLGDGVTRHQARQLVTHGMNATYSSLLGYRPDVIARDLQQVWLSLPRTGPKLLDVMRRYITGGKEVRQAMWEGAVDANMVSLAHPRSIAPGVAKDFQLIAAADPADMIAGNVSRRQLAVGRALSELEDLVPDWAKNDKLRPMHFYGRQGEISRMLAGTAGREQAAEAISAFRAAGPNGDMRRLLQQSKADTFYPAVRREFERLVGLGQDEEAAKFMGRQMADASQFKYGAGEAPMTNRTLSGRMFTQLGSYPMYYVQYLEETLKHGGAATIAKTAAAIGTTSAALMYASRETGWNFNRLNPFTGFGLTTGPTIQAATEIAEAATGATRIALGQSTQGDRMPDLGGAVGGALNLFNPMRGAIRSAGGVMQALDSPTPGQALLRLGITGERGAGPDLGQEVVPLTEQDLLGIMQPMQSPMRMETYGTTEITPRASTPDPISLTQDERQYMSQLQTLPNELQAMALEQYRARRMQQVGGGGGNGGQF